MIKIRVHGISEVISMIDKSFKSATEKTLDESLECIRKVALEEAPRGMRTLKNQMHLRDYLMFPSLCVEKYNYYSGAVNFREEYVPHTIFVIDGARPHGTNHPGRAKDDFIARTIVRVNPMVSNIAKKNFAIAYK